jgi:small GTP-binding protein
MSDNYEVKIILIGESSVGKTSLIRQFIDHYFTEKRLATIGHDILQKEINLSEDKKIILTIWDTCGQEQYRTINQLFVKNAKLVLFVYDITKKKSFEELKNFWYEFVTSILGKNIIFGIAANKSDLYQNEEVNINDAKNFALKIDAILKETSAKNFESINSLIHDMVFKFIEKIEKDSNLEENNNIVIENNKKNKNRCCKEKKSDKGDL